MVCASNSLSEFSTYELHVMQETCGNVFLLKTYGHRDMAHIYT